MKKLKEQYATIRDLKKKIINIESAIASNQAILAVDSVLQDTATDLMAARQNCLVRHALGENMLADIETLDNAIIEAKADDKSANASAKGQTKAAQDTATGLKLALEAAQAALTFEQGEASEMRKAILKARSVEYVAIYEKAAAQLFESMRSILAIDEVFKQHPGVHPDRGLAFQRENFKLSIPGINGGSTVQRHNGADAGYFVDAEKYMLTTADDHHNRVNDTKRLLEE